MEIQNAPNNSIEAKRKAYILSQLKNIERHTEKWIVAVEYQLSLPTEKRLTIYSTDTMAEEIDANETWLQFIRSTREAFLAEPASPRPSAPKPSNSEPVLFELAQSEALQ
jgi:hypothetical protein